MLRADQQHQQCNVLTEQLKQKVAAAEAKLERLPVERHSLLKCAMVLHALSFAAFVNAIFVHFLWKKVWIILDITMIIIILELVSLSRHKGTSAPSGKSPVLDHPHICNEIK